MNHDYVLILCHNKWRTDSNTNSQVGVLFCRHNSNPVNLSYLTNVYQKHFTTLYPLEGSTTNMSFIEKFEDSIRLVKQMNETRSLRSLDLKKGWKTYQRYYECSWNIPWNWHLLTADPWWSELASEVIHLWPRSQLGFLFLYYLRKWHNGDDDDDEVITAALHCICTPVVLY